MAEIKAREKQKYEEEQTVILKEKALTEWVFMSYEEKKIRNAVRLAQAMDSQTIITQRDFVFTEINEF